MQPKPSSAAVSSDSEESPQAPHAKPRYRVTPDPLALPSPSQQLLRPKN